MELKWIPVNERMPDYDKDVLIIYQGNVIQAKLTKEGEFSDWDGHWFEYNVWFCELKEDCVITWEQVSSWSEMPNIPKYAFRY